MTTELQDDSDIVRDTVSYGVSELLKQQHQEKQQFYLQPTRVMEKVCGLIGKEIEDMQFLIVIIFFFLRHDIFHYLNYI